MTKLVVLALLLIAAPAFARTAKGDVRIHEYEVDAEDGVVPLGQFVEVQSAARKATRVRSDDRLLPGARMRVRGYLDYTSGELVPDAGVQGVTLITSALTATPAHAVEHLLVVPISFPDKPAVRTPASIAEDYRRIPPWIERSSYGRTTVAVDVHSTVTSNRSFASLACSFSQVVNEAVRLTDATVDFLAVTVINVVLPAVDWQTMQTLCPNGGAGGAYVGRWPVSTKDGEVALGQTITNEGWTASIHELGHTFGLNHANGLACGDQMLPGGSLAGCVSREYGDPFDSMGQAFGDWSATRKAQLGWMQGGGERIARLTETGTYVIDALESPALPGTISIKGLRVPYGAGSVMLESRASQGNDSTYPFTWLQGVSMRADLEGRWLDNDHYLVGSNQTQALWPEAPSRALPTATLTVGGARTVGPWHVKVVDRDDSTGSTTVRCANERCSDNTCFLSCARCIVDVPGGYDKCFHPFAATGLPAGALRWIAINPFCADLLDGLCWEECPGEDWTYP